MAQGTYVYLDYTVIAAQAPTVRFTATPARVEAGQLGASVDVTDNRSVARVVFSVDRRRSRSHAYPGTSGYSATLSAAGLGAGTNTCAGSRVPPRRARVGGLLGVREVYEGPPVIANPTRLGAFTPYFATKRGCWGRLGTLIGLGDVAGPRPGSRILICCTEGLRAPRSMSHAKPRPADARA